MVAMKLTLTILLLASTAVAQPAPPRAVATGPLEPPAAAPWETDAITAWKAAIDAQRAGYVAPPVTKHVTEFNFTPPATNGVWRTLIQASTNFIEWTDIQNLPMNTAGMTFKDTNNSPFRFYRQVLAWETVTNQP